MKINLLMIVGLLCMALVACGPTKQDEVAAKSGCLLAETYELAFEKADADEFEKNRAMDQLISRTEGYFSSLERASVETVKQLIEESCPETAKYVDVAVKKYADSKGVPASGIPAGYENLFKAE